MELKKQFLSAFILMAATAIPIQAQALAQGSTIGAEGGEDAGQLTRTGFAYAKSAQYAKAVESLKRAVRLKPGLVEAHYLLGVAYNNMNLYEEAIGAFREAVRLKPGWGEAFSGLGVAY